MNSLLSYLTYLPKRFGLPFVMLAVLVLPLTVFANNAPGSIQYQGANTRGTDHAAFNVFYDVPSQGNEADFLRVAPSGTTSWTNTTEACDGKLVDLNVYIHNGAEIHNNGTNFNGPGVAKDSRLKIALPTGISNTKTLNATVSASNASSVSDTAFITCGNQKVELEYVTGSAEIFSANRGVDKLSDDVVSSNGTSISSFDDKPGVIPGCWEYRVWVKVTVKLKVIEEPTPIYSCTSLDAILVDRDSRKLKAVAEAKNSAKVVSYNFNFGDGQTELVTTNALNATTKSHDYAPGNYTAKVDVNFDINGDGVTDKTKTCQTNITVEEEPETPIYECSALTLTPKSILINKSTTAKVTIVTKNGATLKSVSFDWGDGTAKTVTTNLSAEHTYTKVGKFTVTTVVTFNVGDEVKSATCTNTVEVGEVLSEKPPTKELPNTGFASVLTGFFGTGALGMSVKSWLESRTMLRRGALNTKE